MRAVSLQTGYLIKANGDGACILYYLTQVDPRGECPQEGGEGAHPELTFLALHPPGPRKKGCPPPPWGCCRFVVPPPGLALLCLSDGALGSCRLAAEVGGEPRVPVRGTEGKWGCVAGAGSHGQQG